MLSGRTSTDHVLNAFRHQRNDHSLQQLLEIATREVLNAFRHQRNDHSSARMSAATPSGAQRLPASKERSHGVDPCAEPLKIVLNAFRHQRNDHSMAV